MKTYPILKVTGRFGVEMIPTDKGECYRISEVVTSQGLYIDWGDIYSCKINAIKRILKYINIELTCYASGSGSLSFSFNHKGESVSWQIKDVAKEIIIKDYFNNHIPYADIGKTETWKERGYLLHKFNSFWQLFKPVTRVDHEILSHEGENYRYETIYPSIYRMFFFNPYAHEEQEMQNINTRAILRFYLENEKEILNYMKVFHNENI